MDVTWKSTTDISRCRICKKETSETVVFIGSGINIEIATCNEHYKFIRQNYLDFMRKQVSSIKSAFEINKSIKFFESTNIKTGDNKK